jgi:hypothetical protein
MSRGSRSKLINEPGLLASSVKRARTSSSISPLKALLVTAAEISLTCLLVAWVQVQYRFIPAAVANRVESHSIPAFRGITFGDKFKMRGFKLTRQRGGTQINTVWQSLRSQKLEYINVIQLLKEDGKVVSSHDYFQDSFSRNVAPGQIWEDKIFLSRAQLVGVSKIGVEIYKPGSQSPLIADSSRTDWNGRRLLIPLE